MLILYNHGNCSSSKKLFLLQRETITESHNWSKYREQLTVGYTRHTSTMQALRPKIRGYDGRGCRRITRLRGWGTCCDIEPSVYDKEAVPMKFQFHELLISWESLFIECQKRWTNLSCFYMIWLVASGDSHWSGKKQEAQVCRGQGRVTDGTWHAEGDVRDMR